MIPGVISTGLESWGTEEASRQYFRKRLWGSCKWNIHTKGLPRPSAKFEGSMMRALVLDKAGWKRHIMLDKLTGLDPQGIKLRAAQGFDATDLYVEYKALNPAILISCELHYGILDMEQNPGKSCNDRIRPVGHLCNDSPPQAYNWKNKCIYSRLRLALVLRKT